MTDREWGEYVFMRENKRGLHKEQWLHAGCRRWFKATRDTVTYDIKGYEKFGGEAAGNARRGHEQMSQKDRLGTGGRINRAIPLTFTFNGRTYQGFQGDTLASALLANGVHFVARSFKYHRPRGIVTADVAEPNAVVQLESGVHGAERARDRDRAVPAVASSVNAEPSLENDKYAINQKLSRFLPAGFYYKTFMWPRNMWPKYEEKIREAAGLGKAPEALDADRYDKCYAHCDVLVVGGGPSASRPRTAATAGARVILVDDQRGSAAACCRAAPRSTRSPRCSGSRRSRPSCASCPT